MENFLANGGTFLTALITLLTALWRFAQSPLGQAIVNSIRTGSFTQARKVLEDHAMCIATKYQQTLVKGLKEDMADGVITPDEMKKRLAEVKMMALADFKSSAEGGAIGATIDMLGVKDKDKFLDALLEGAVHRLGLSSGALLKTEETVKTTATRATDSQPMKAVTETTFTETTTATK